MKIPVADHDPTSRLVVTRTLSELGHQVVLADNGPQALDVLQRNDPPRVAILDVNLESMSGIEVCRGLRENKDASACYVLLMASGLRSLACIPECGANDVVAKPVDQSTLKTRLNLAFRVIELEERCRALEDSKPDMDRDAGTGIWSRSAILEFVRGQFARSTRDGISLAVIVAEPDELETIETSFGTAAKDTVMREMARRFAQSIRPYDLLGRYGHGELLVVVPDCTITNALTIGERLRRLVADRVFDIGDKEINVTSSFGVATTADTGALDEDGLLRSANAALYKARENGCDRVEIAKRIARNRFSNARFTPVVRAKELVQ